MTREINSYDPIRKYFEEIGNTPLLSREEEINLVGNMKDARNNYLRLLVRNTCFLENAIKIFDKNIGSCSGSPKATRRKMDNKGDYGDYREKAKTNLSTMRKLVGKIRKYSKIHYRNIDKNETLNKIYNKCEILMKELDPTDNVLEEIFRKTNRDYQEISYSYVLGSTREYSEKIHNTKNDFDSFKEKIVRSNLKLVASIAKKYKRTSHLSFLDLINEGNMGLMRAVESYDHLKGKFSTYATPWINQRIRRAIQGKENTIYHPVNVINDNDKKVMKTSSLDRPLDSEESKEDQTLLNIIEGPNGIEKRVETNILSDTIKEVLEKLGDREKEIIERRFGLNGHNKQTLEGVGNEYNLSRERVRQIEEQTIEKMRHPRTARKLEQFLWLIE